MMLPSDFLTETSLILLCHIHIWLADVLEHVIPALRLGVARLYFPPPRVGRAAVGAMSRGQHEKGLGKTTHHATT